MADAENTGDQEKANSQDVLPSSTPQSLSVEQSSEETVTEKPAERTRSKIMLIMLALCLAVFLAAIDISIVTTAIPTITGDLQSESVYTWIGSSYLLAQAATTIIWAKVSDVFGRKPVLLLVIIIFFIGSLIAALSINVGMLLAARAIQGCGGSGLLVLSNICIGDIFSPRVRGMYYGILSGVWAVASSLGPIVGGIFTQRVSWRWCFYINLPFDGLAFIILLLYLDVKTPRTPFLDGIKAIDWVGALLSVSGTLLLLFGLSYGGSTFPWKSAIVICLIVFGIICWCLCLIWETYLAKYPILSTRIFRNKGTLACLTVSFIQSFVYISSPYYLPLYFQAVLDANPILSGVYLLPLSVGLSAASIYTGFYMRKTGNYLVPITSGYVLQLLGFGLFINLGSTADWAKIIIFQLIAGLGCGPNFQAPMVGLQSLVSPRDLSSATSGIAFTRYLAGSTSIVVGQVIFQNEVAKRQGVLTNALGPQLAAQLGDAAGANVQAIEALPPGERDIVHSVFADSLSYIWVMYTAVSALGLLLCFLVAKKTLTNEHKETETGLEAEKLARLERLEEERVRREAKKGKEEA